MSIKPMKQSFEDWYKKLDESYTRSMVYPFPIRGNYRAQLVLPEDLTTLEAKRLSAFIQTLVIDEAPHGITGEKA